MQRKFKEKFCKGCGDFKPIVYSAGCLCNNCNNDRKRDKYMERAKDKPMFSEKAIATMKGDKDTYMELWETKSHVCEECGVFLGNFTAEEAAKFHKEYFSHILKKGMYGKIRHDLRNFNLLCLEHHSQWEGAHTRKNMNIFAKNKPVMIELLKEYGYTK